MQILQEADPAQRDEVTHRTSRKGEHHGRSEKENFFARAGKRISRWFREMKSELKKVVWPTKSQMVNNTVIVLVCTLIVGICIWVFDAVGGVVVNGLITLVRG